MLGNQHLNWHVNKKFKGIFNKLSETYIPLRLTITYLLKYNFWILNLLRDCEFDNLPLNDIIKTLNAILYNLSTVNGERFKRCEWRTRVSTKLVKMGIH